MHELNPDSVQHDCFGSFPHDVEYYTNRLRTCKESENKLCEASALRYIGCVNAQKGKLEAALDYLRRAQTLFHEAGENRGEAIDLMDKAGIEEDLEQYRDAVTDYEDSLPTFAGVDYVNETQVLHALGLVYRQIGEEQKALGVLTDALSIEHNNNDKGSDEAHTLIRIGDIYWDLGQKQMSLERFETAASTFHELGDTFGEALVLNNIRRTSAVFGRPLPGCLGRRRDPDRR